MLAELIAIGVLLAGPHSEHAGLLTVSSTCSELGTVLGGCPNVSGGIQGDGAVLDGELTMGGGPGSSNPGGGGGTSGGTTLPPMPCEEVFAGFCYGEGQGKPGESAPGVPGVPSLTLSDVAMFRPQPAVQYMEPDGWMVVGLPTNFVAVIESHIVAGSLLGALADVRFTPVAYRWRYGDGSSARLGTTGASWRALGLREFDSTATSHLFRASGTYAIKLDVEYTAEYRFSDGAWTPLIGVIVLPANDLVATAGAAVTVLVDRDCGRAPSGPGC